jgi:hypothetical protein
LHTKDLLNWNGKLDNRNGSKDDCTADVESAIEQGNCIEDPECPDEQDLSAALNVPALI